MIITRAAITMHYLTKCLLPLPRRGLYGSHITNVHVIGCLCGSIGTDRGSIIGRSSPYYVQYTVSVYCTACLFIYLFKTLFKHVDPVNLS